VDAELALQRGDVQSALVLLKSVTRGDPCYVRARIATADIHLKHRNNKKLYLRAYEDLVDEEAPTIPAVCMLADAYMRLQVPLRPRARRRGCGAEASCVCAVPGSVFVRVLTGLGDDGCRSPTRRWSS